MHRFFCSNLFVVWITILTLSITKECRAGCPSDDQNNAIAGYRYNTGSVITSIETIGIKMCVDICNRTGGCQYINYKTKHHFCDLVQSDNISVIPTLEEEDGSYFVEMHQKEINKTCGSSECGELSMCVTSARQNKACVSLERTCSEKRYLVTGKHGVTSDRVTYSSFYPGVIYYELGSTSGWAPAISDLYQWIQVVFLSKRIVLGIITEPRYGYTQWVTSYSVEFLDDSNEWTYITDQSGNKMTFPGNNGKDNYQINELISPLVTNGIKIRPITYTYYMTLRFDVIGC